MIAAETEAKVIDGVCVCVCVCVCRPCLISFAAREQRSWGPVAVVTAWAAVSHAGQM